MTLGNINLSSGTDEEERAAVIAFLGGARGIGGKATDALQLHDRIVRGFPLRALQRFETRCPSLARDNVFGLLLERSIAADVRRRLTAQQSAQLWRLANFVVTAAPLFEGVEATEHWMLKPANRLGGRRPVDLLASPPGHQIAVDHLVRIAYGVYI